MTSAQRNNNENTRNDMKGKKTGGRTKGTPNKTTVMNKRIINSLLADYSDSGLMSKDFMELEPKDRLGIAEKLMQYVMPKMQSTNVDLSVNDEKKTLEDTLADLSQPPADKQE